MKYIGLLLTASLFYFSCNKSDIAKTCDEKATLDKERFAKRSEIDKALKIIGVPTITANCLEVKLAYSGCSGGHKIDLINNGAVAESLPLQSSLALIENDPQLCDAYFEEVYTYDLTGLKTLFGDAKEVKFNFTDQQKSVLWKIE